MQTASLPLVIVSAAYNKNSQMLVVKTTVKNNMTGILTLLHGDGGILKQAAAKAQQFAIPISQLGKIPCSVEARLNHLTTSKTVAGAPTDCAKVSLCEIISPVNGANVKASTLLDFKGLAKSRNPNPIPKAFTYKWNFASGVFEKSHPTSTSGKVKFVHNNNVYRIRFAATDNQNRRCEAAVEIGIVTPAGLPAQVAKASAPRRGNAMPDIQSLVVIPFQE